MTVTQSPCTRRCFVGESLDQINPETKHLSKIEERNQNGAVHSTRVSREDSTWRHQKSAVWRFARRKAEQPHWWKHTFTSAPVILQSLSSPPSAKRYIQCSDKPPHLCVDALWAKICLMLWVAAGNYRKTQPQTRHSQKMMHPTDTQL